MFWVQQAVKCTGSNLLLVPGSQFDFEATSVKVQAVASANETFRAERGIAHCNKAWQGVTTSTGEAQMQHGAAHAIPSHPYSVYVQCVWHSSVWLITARMAAASLQGC